MSHHHSRHTAETRDHRELKQLELIAMALSKEVQTALDEIKRNKSLADSTAAADKLRDQKIKDQQAAIDDLNAKIAAIPVNQEMSQEDKDALTQGVADLKASGDELVAINSQLQTAVPANTPGPDAPAAPVAAGNPGQPAAPASASGGIDGPSTADGGPAAPLMPTSAFDPAGGTKAPASTGQPQQATAIETPGGFVIAGGGSTARAPGSMPDSPSSSIVIPTDPDAKGPSSNADVIKSGLGDPGQNALTDADGRTAEQITAAQEASQPSPEAAQKQQDLLAKERAAREDNPLNLAPEGTPQAGSADADKAALARRTQEQRDAVAKQQDQDRAEQGKPAPGTPGPDPVSGPTTSPA